MASRNKTASLSDSDIRLLRVFQAVVRQRGFAAAQSELGLSPATISNHIANLETRLGVRLCSRGRKGFALTPEGTRLHEASLNVIRSLENFSTIVGSVRGELSGTVHFGTVDAMHTNAKLNLSSALAGFSQSAPNVVLHIDISSPHDLRQRLLDGRYQLILTPIEERHSSIASVRLFDEEQSLYCGSTHPLFELPDRALKEALAQKQRYAARAYTKDWRSPSYSAIETTAVTSHMESLALLILSGSHIGHLPSHYAQQWVDAGDMRCLLPKAMSYFDTFRLAHLSSEQNRAVALLRDCIMKYGKVT